MPLANSKTRYGSVAKTLHWITALGILAAIPLGLVANELAHAIRAPGAAATETEIARTATLFSLHKTLGVVLFFTALTRILWALLQTRPGLLNADRKAEAFLAETVHWLLYSALLLVPLTGWAHHAATTGFAPILWPFGQSLPFVPKLETAATLFATLHVIFQRILILAVFLHIAGALKHHVIDRDATLRRMLPGRPDLPPLPSQHRSVLPAIAALAIWGAAFGVGLVLGSEDHEPNGSALADVASEWRVDSGTLGITVTQMGTQVDGAFADWTASIAFAPSETDGPAGTVEVTIAIGSLTLGSVSDQAMGPDFFDTERFPTATFQGEIFREDGLYVAKGPLTIKGMSQDIALPFSLSLEGDNAKAEGSVALARLDFAIGESMKDGSSLGLSVDVAFSLIATRNNS